MKELLSKERRLPRGYWKMGEFPIELREMAGNLWAEGLLPSFESLPPQIILTPELSNLINSDFAIALEKKNRGITRHFLYGPDVGILASEKRQRDFYKMRRKRLISIIDSGWGRTPKYTLRRYNLVFLGTIYSLPFQKEAFFKQGEMEYFLSHPTDLFIIAVAKEGLKLALKSEETKSGPEPLIYHRIRPLLIQYYKLCEPDSLRRVKEEYPEISGEASIPVLRRQIELAFNLKVAQEFSLGLYSSSNENPEILERIQ